MSRTARLPATSRPDLASYMRALRTLDRRLDALDFWTGLTRLVDAAFDPGLSSAHREAALVKGLGFDPERQNDLAEALAVIVLSAQRGQFSPPVIRHRADIESIKADLFRIADAADPDVANTTPSAEQLAVAELAAILPLEAITRRKLSDGTLDDGRPWDPR